MTGVAGKILRILDRRERGQVLGLIVLVLVTAFIETLGIASILPFIIVMTDPSVVQTNPWLALGYEFFGFGRADRYLMALGAAMLALLVLGNMLKAWTRWGILNLSHGIGGAVSRRLFGYYIDQPYDFFLRSNPAHLCASVLDEAQSLAKDVMIPSLDIIARVFLVLAIVVLLVAVDPVLALAAAAILSVAYAVVYHAFRKRLLVYGTDRRAAQKERYKIVHEAFSGIKNIKLTGHEETYRRYYDAPSRRYASSLSLSGAIADMPRYILEVVGFGAIMLALLYMLSAGNDLTDILPVLALYAFAGYRLVPNLQIIYACITRLRFNLPIIDAISAVLEKTQIENPSDTIGDDKALPFHTSIELRNVCFGYQEGARPVLQNLNLDIKANTTVGIVGRTGSGKTTLVDILTGLLYPREGALMVDGVAIEGANRRAWQSNIAYVSQHTYLVDDTLRANIAFGVPADEIDDARVREAARLACISDFIEGELPLQYETLIGDNGVRLSGGQRQRIALARALYLNRPVLVMDEVTSALDIATEDDVMQAISALSHRKTIIIISHRPSIVRFCDVVFDVEAQGVVSDAA